MKSGWIVACAVVLATGVAPGCECNPTEPDSGVTDVTLSIIAPVSGSLFGLNDDSTGGTLLPGAIGTLVTVVATDSSSGAPLAGLMIEVTTNGGSAVTATTDANGEVSFPDYPLEADDIEESVVNLLEATEPGSGASDAITVTTDIRPPVCDITTPVANDILDCGDDLDANPVNGVQVDVVVSTDAGNGQPVQLSLNGILEQTQSISGGTGSFGNVTLNPGGTNDLEASCVDAAGNEGTGSISVTVDCVVPVCQIDSLSPMPACYALDDVITVDYSCTGVTPGDGVVQCFVNGQPAYVGTNNGTALITVADPPWTNGSSNTIECVVTDPANGITTFPVPSGPYCAMTDALDPAPTMLFPSCPATLNVTEDGNPAPGFQTTLGVSVCCVNWSVDVDCPTTGVTTTNFTNGPGDPNCDFLFEEVTLESDATCSLTFTCIDDSDPTMMSTSTACDITVTPQPVLTITAPPDGTVSNADSDGMMAGCQGIDVDVSGAGFPGITDLCLIDVGSGITVAGPLAFDPAVGTGSFVGVSFPDGTSTVRVEECTGNTAITDEVTYTCDVTTPPMVTDLSCAVNDVRTGETCCTWTHDTDCASYDIQWGRNGGPNFTYGSLFDGQELTDGLTMPFCFAGPPLPRVGDRVVTRLTCTDGAGNVSPLSNLNQTTANADLLPTIAAGTDPGVSMGEGFGHYIAGGDFNGDGFDDLAVSSDLNLFDGRIYIWFGSAAGIDPATMFASSADVIIQGATNDTLGYGLTGIGDWDGDGLDDLAFAVFGGGTVHIIEGSTIALLSGLTLFNTISTLQVLAPMGSFVFDFGAGYQGQKGIAGCDLNGDGLSDLIIGGDDHPGMFAGSDTGGVWVVLGQSMLDGRWNGMNQFNTAMADVTLTGLADGDGFGTHVACTGPVEPGGMGGFVVGAPQYNDGVFFFGAADGYAAVFSFDDLTAPMFVGDVSDAVAVLSAPAGSGIGLGASVAGIGDYAGTGGGLGGVAVAAPDANVLTMMPNGNGGIFIFVNDGTGLTSSANVGTDADIIYRISGVSLTSNLGFRMAGSPITSGSYTGLSALWDTDGPLPVLAFNRDTTANRVYGMYGHTLAVPPGSFVIQADFDFALPGTTSPGAPDDIGDVQFVGDLNGDGHLDLVVGYPLSAGGDGEIVIYY